MQIFTKKHGGGSQGFTLIELLVVIAIIGILSSIVLVSLGGARDKAKDATIQANLTQVRTVAEIEYIDGGNSYDGLAADADYVTLIAGITAQGGTVTDEDSATAYCTSSTLNAGGAWCVDSTGYSGSVATCDALTCDCAVD